jgi:pimeloyl-ACP methyl ester carboxylesterase
VNDLTAHPRTISVTNPLNDQQAGVVIDGFKLAELVGPGSNNADLRSRIPSLVHDLATGGGTEAALELLPKRLPAGLWGYGLQWGVQCSEYVPFTTLKQMLADAKQALPAFPDEVLSLLPQTPYVFSDCEKWDVKPAGRRVTAPTHSDVPVLLVSGALDPITPPSWAATAARTLPNSRQLVFPGAGHGVFHWSPECFVTIMGNFLNQPQGFDDRCLREVRTAAPFDPN